MLLESLFSRLRMHWDHEPTPNPSQEGNRVDADECLFPSWEGSGVGRFMESGCKKVKLSLPNVGLIREIVSASIRAFGGNFFNAPPELGGARTREELLVWTNQKESILQLLGNRLQDDGGRNAPTLR